MLLLLALACLSGCASAPAPKERSVLLETRQEVFLILPLNVAASMPEELATYGPVVWEALERYLRAQGKELKTISRGIARKLWVESIALARAGEKGARAGYDDAALLLAQKLRSHAEFDAMIMPSLFIREATISKKSARWDGVEQELLIETRGVGAKRLAETPFEGTAPAASLHITAFGPSGGKLHDDVGGLELLVGVRVVGSNLSGTPAFQLAPRADLFQNADALQTAIAAAFEPFLAPPPE